MIDWANENGLRIDDWQVGHIPDDNWDEAEWIRRGRAISDAEAILQHILVKGDTRIDPVLVVRGLGYIGTLRSVPLLVEQLTSDRQTVRRNAIWALGQIGGPEAVRTLAGEVISARTRDERLMAAVALKKLADPIGISAMEDAIRDIQYQQKFIEEQLSELRQTLQEKGTDNRSDSGDGEENVSG